MPQEGNDTNDAVIVLGQLEWLKGAALKHLPTYGLIID